MIATRDAVTADGAALATMARRCFVETFGAHYPSADMAAFLDVAFGEAGLPAQLGDPAYAIRIAIDDTAIVGFAKMAATTLPGPPDAMELKQLYVLAPWQGAGVAATLMDWVIAHARAAGAAHLVLSVWEHNARAQRFYARYGMAPIGRAPFRVGSVVDDDPVWAMAL